MNREQRLYILNDDDIRTLYDRPVFTDVERRHFFKLSDDVINRLAIRQRNPRRVASIAYFILQYGYFKAKHHFFSFTCDEVQADIDFILIHAK